MNARPPDGSDEPEAVDQVMLAVLSNRGRDAIVLSADQERLLDDWVAGRLTPDDAERAAVLVRQNTLAAERVLERRLQVAASEGPAVPRALTAQVLKASAPRKVSATGAWWRSLGRWQWTSIAGAAALASILVVAGMPVLQQMLSSGGPLQVAMVTISDRSPLFEASDLRMRGTTPPGPVVGERFRDIEMSVSLLKDLVATTGQAKSATSREVERYVLGAGQTVDHPIQVIVDSSLKQRLDTTDRDRMLVRVYDLNDPRSANVKSLVGLPPGNKRAFLLTVRP
ncbi:MAG: hypothetical protein HYX38_35495 [Rhodospirillales bacterium]|nr:hypothetical protein [Rhodospirillales bacterium]